MKRAELFVATAVAHRRAFDDLRRRLRMNGDVTQRAKDAKGP
jgi:hypothetical protein